NNKNLYYNLRHGEIQIILDEVKEYNEFSIVFKKDSALETTTFKNENFFTFYNPENKHLELYNIDSISNIESLNIYNTLGQIIISLNSLEANTINISNLNDGIYILKVKTKNAQKLKNNKFVKY
ncbi:T9SS type A sorting domain-containing protein, partial [Flavivirga aquatica]|uniref:T9SS type A sorting domain-containing protein n=1 Tax=Flavivirga aquatica TaxID=1849968 RepID=UPI0010426165